MNLDDAIAEKQKQLRELESRYLRAVELSKSKTYLEIKADGFSRLKSEIVQYRQGQSGEQAIFILGRCWMICEQIGEITDVIDHYESIQKSLRELVKAKERNERTT